MSQLISSFPDEVIEHILLYLQGENLINASEVCWQWNNVAYRIMEKVVHSVFSTELREDILLDVNEKLGDPLLDVYREAIEELHLENNMHAITLESDITALECDGTNIFIGDSSGQLKVYEVIATLNSESYMITDPAVTAHFSEAPILQLGLMKCKEILFVVTASYFYMLSTARVGKEGKICLEHQTANQILQHKSRTFRIHQDLLGTAESPSHLKIFRVDHVRSGKVTMVLLTEFHTSCGIYRWKIWNNQVLCVLKTGGLIVYDLTAKQVSHQSESYHELRYQNPCYMFQRYILCSTELSRNLLCRYIYMMPTCPAAYWHISCGPSYWLFGRLDGKHSPAPEKYRQVLSTDVTTLCLHRRLIVCARRNPDVIVIYQMPRNLPHDKEALTHALQTPILTLPAFGHVTMLDVAFMGPRILVYSVTKPALLHCYILTRVGHGTTPSPSPSPEPCDMDLEMLNIPNIDHNLAYPVANE